MSASLSKSIGTLLIERGEITQQQLDTALSLQSRTQNRLGNILYKIGACNQLSLYRALAEQQELPFIDLEKSPPDANLLKAEHIKQYLRLNALPWRADGKHSVTIVTASITQEVTEWAEQSYGETGYQFALTSERDVERALAQNFQDFFTYMSCDGLWQKSPALSARQTILRKHSKLAIICSFFIGAFACFFPLEAFLTTLILINCFCLGTLIFKALLFLKGIKLHDEQEKLPPKPFTFNIPDHELPIYSILVPMYDEANSLPALLDNLRQLDYPQDKLDIKLILEADDEKTISAAKALKPEGRFNIITVPPSQPRTKPKACNYALRFCKGEFITIYDAEDKPDPLQLKKVISTFREGGEELVCIQCRLNYYNRSENLLTALFSIEYAAWFNYMLNALDHYKLPIPLGGTSNHIYKQRLIELGEWDPYNVTEDADLGVRLSAQQFRTQTLDSLTLEEAPATLWAWIKQRSRWIKGHMQTWLVHMRHPVALYKNLGARGFWGFQFFIGGPCLVFLSTPFIILSSLYFLQSAIEQYSLITQLALALSATVLLCSLLVHSFMAFVVLFHQQWTECAPAAIVFPFYWILHSLASFRGLWQLFTKPHYWDKTAHGENAKQGT